MEKNYRLVRSKRKTVSISLDKNGEVLVKAGLTTKESFIQEFVQKNAAWIDKQQAKFAYKMQGYKPLTDEEKAELRQSAVQILEERTKLYSQIMGVRPAGIKITSATTRWGSCSPTNSICYSYRVMFLPEECRDYIVVHELAHIRIRNHSGKFYQEVEKYLPNYKQLRQQIKNFQCNDLP